MSCLLAICVANANRLSLTRMEHAHLTLRNCHFGELTRTGQLAKPLLEALIYIISATLDKITPPQSENPCGGNRIINVSSITNSRLTGLLVGIAAGLLLILVYSWTFSRCVLQVTAKVRRLKQRLRTMVQMLVLGVYLFGPPLFAAELRDEEPDNETGVGNLEGNRDLAEWRERTKPSNPNNARNMRLSL